MITKILTKCKPHLQSLNLSSINSIASISSLSLHHYDHQRHYITKSNTLTVYRRNRYNNVYQYSTTGSRPTKDSNTNNSNNRNIKNN